MWTITFSTWVLKRASWAITPFMKLEAITPRDIKVLSNAGCWNRFAGMNLRLQPQFPMYSPPGKRGGLRLAQKTEVFIIITPIMPPSSQILNSSPILGYRAVKIPTYTWKAWSQTSIDVIRLALFTGSRANDGEEPSWKGWSVIRNLSSKAGLTRREPKSTNSFWMILLRILAVTRASIGRFTDMKTSLGRCVPGGRGGCWVEDDETRCGGKETKASKAWAEWPLGSLWTTRRHLRKTRKQQQAPRTNTEDSKYSK